MLLAEPPRTQGDIHFRIGDTPVRIHPFFWVTTLLLGIRIGEQIPPLPLFIWVFAVLVSILVHEFGHAIMQRHYGGRPRITLYGLGGLASCNDCDRSSKAQIQISLAGPIAGFLVAIAILTLLVISGYWVGLRGGDPLKLVDQGYFPFPFFGVNLVWKRFDTLAINLLISDFLWINILWGLINLLPIYPLDGGRVSQEVCMMRGARQGIILAWQISMVCAIGMVLVSLIWGSLFAVVLFGFLAYSSYRSLEAYKASLW